MFEVGVDNGRYYSLNVPLRDGIDDQSNVERYDTCCSCQFIYLLFVYKICRIRQGLPTEITLH